MNEIFRGRPMVAFLLFLAVPLVRFSLIPAFSMTRYALCVIVSVSLAAYLIASMRAGRPEFSVTAIDALFFMMYVVYLLSCVFSRNVYVSFAEAMQELVYPLAYILLRMLVSGEKTGIIFMSAAAFCITISAVVMSAWGLAQYFLEFDVPSGMKALFKTYHFPVVASMGNPNFLAEYLVLALPAAVSWMAWRGRYGALRIIVVLVGLTVYLTYSRLAWFALAVCMIAIIAAAPWKKRLKIGGSFLLLICVTGAFFAHHYTSGSTKSERIIRSFDMSDAAPLFERRVIYRSALAMVEDAGIFGMGPGMFGYRYLAYQGDYIRANNNKLSRHHCVDLDHAHNDYMEIVVDSGYLAVALYIALIIAAGAAGLRAVRKGKTDEPLFYMYISPLLFALFSCWSFPFYLPNSKMLLVLALALAAGHSAVLKPIRVSGRIIPIALIVVIVVTCCYSTRNAVSIYHYNRGLRYFRSDFDRASLHFARGIQAYPFNGYNYLSMGALLLNQKKSMGLRYLRESLRYMDNSTIYLNIARGYREHGRIELAKAWYKKLVDMRPDIRRAYWEYREIIDRGR